MGVIGGDILERRSRRAPLSRKVVGDAIFSPSSNMLASTVRKKETGNVKRET
jgi:hypothetical protein